jgi:primosomal protein N' (replication factor Y)
MASEMFARVVFQSPLPALNREFEYSVPQELQSTLLVGQRVKVSFAGQSKEGFVVGIAGTKEFSGKLSEIAEIVSDIPVLSQEIYLLLKTISIRQCCSVGEIIGNAVPKRAVRVEKSFSYKAPNTETRPTGVRMAELVEPVANAQTGNPVFLERLAKKACEYFEAGRSVIVCVPDFRDLKRISAELSKSVSQDAISTVDSNELASLRYQNFLDQLASDQRIVIGTRNAIYSPVSGDAAIIIWDDGDQSHQDQQAPYLTTREIALIRQDLFGAPIHFFSHSRSTEVQRLVRIGYLSEAEASSWRPKVLVTDGTGLDGITFQVIKRALESGPVLVQVASPGNARSLYCNSCSVRSMCKNCNGPLWMNAKAQIVCRWCGNLNLDFKCPKCLGTKLRQGAAGATRWAEQLGKSFPGIPVREVSVEQEEHRIPNRPALVICTAGIEPIADGGFAGVILLDCATQLNVDSLRAPEDSLRAWLNAVAFMRPGAQAAAVGVSDEVSRALTLGQVIETVDGILSEREILGFPPTKRFVSATGTRQVIDSLARVLEAVPALLVLGISEAQSGNASSEFRLVASFAYSNGPMVSSIFREFIANLKSNEIRTNLKSGKNVRPLTIKFDDPRVI